MTTRGGRQGCARRPHSLPGDVSALRRRGTESAINRTNYNVVYVSTRSCSSSLVLVGAVLALIGGWVAIVALVGPYFSFGFDTTRTWLGSERHWTLSVGPGITLAVAGVLITRGGIARSRLGAVLALAAGIWLVVGPFLHGIWSSESQVIASLEWKRALLWIGWYVGNGAAAIAFASYALGLLARQRFAGSVLVEMPAQPEPVSEPEKPVLQEEPASEAIA